MKFSVRIVVYIFFPRNDIFVYIKTPFASFSPSSFVEWNLFYIPAAAPQRLFFLAGKIVERVISAAHSTGSHTLFLRQQ